MSNIVFWKRNKGEQDKMYRLAAAYYSKSHVNENTMLEYGYKGNGTPILERGAVVPIQGCMTRCGSTQWISEKQVHDYIELVYAHVNQNQPKARTIFDQVKALMGSKNTL